MEFTCEECGKQFEADPSSMVETFVTMQHEAEPGEEWKMDGHLPELSEKDRERAKKELGSHGRAA